MAQNIIYRSRTAFRTSKANGAGAKDRPQLDDSGQPIPLTDDDGKPILGDDGKPRYAVVLGKPLTFVGRNAKRGNGDPLPFSEGGLSKYTMPDPLFAEWIAEPDAAKRDAILSRAPERPIAGKVPVTTVQVEAIRARYAALAAAVDPASRPTIGEGKAAHPATDAEMARIMFAADLSSGVLVIVTPDDDGAKSRGSAVRDDTATVLAEMFADA